MEESVPSPKEISPLFAEEILMLEGLEDEELEHYLDENPRIVPLFEINVLGIPNRDYGPRRRTR